MSSIQPRAGRYAADCMRFFTGFIFCKLLTSGHLCVLMAMILLQRGGIPLNIAENARNIFVTGETAYAVDRRGRIVAWNQAAELTFGVLASEALGQYCWELLSGQDIFGNPLCCAGCPIRASAFDNQPIYRFEVYLKTASRESQCFKISTLMLCNEPDEGVLVHLCTPASETRVTRNSRKRNAVNLPEPVYEHKPLTDRETQVLTLLHKGKSIPDIARALKISQSTVRNHVQHVLLKLRVHSRYEAVAVARKFDLI